MSIPSNELSKIADNVIEQFSDLELDLLLERSGCFDPELSDLEIPGFCTLTISSFGHYAVQTEVGDLILDSGDQMELQPGDHSNLALAA